MSTPDPTEAELLTVSCPDCAAPTGEPCFTSLGRPHRARLVRWVTGQAVAGVCGLCGQELMRGSLDGGATVTTWHAEPGPDPCPPFPDPLADWPGFAAAITAGHTPGHPAVSAWHPSNVPAPGQSARIITRGSWPVSTRLYFAEESPAVDPGFMELWDTTTGEASQADEDAPYGTYATGTGSLPVCGRCGALIGNQALHDQPGRCPGA